eukprot:tig00021373_g21077.t1
MVFDILSPRKRSAFPAQQQQPVMPQEPVYESVDVCISGRAFVPPAPAAQSFEPYFPHYNQQTTAEAPAPASPYKSPRTLAQDPSALASPARVRSPFKAETEPPLPVEPPVTSKLGEEPTVPAPAPAEEGEGEQPAQPEGEAAPMDQEPCDCGDCDSSEAATTETGTEAAGAAGPLSPSAADKENNAGAGPRSISARNLPNLPEKVYVKRFGADRVFHTDKKCKRFMQKKAKESAIKHHMTPCGKCSAHLVPAPKAPAVTSPLRQPAL